MDGVLVDFSAGILSNFGMAYPKTRIPQAEFNAFHDELFSRIGKMGESFWENLPMMDGAKELVQSIIHLNPKILTAYPNGSTSREIYWCRLGKMLWLSKNLPEIDLSDGFTLCHARDKWLSVGSHQNVNYILVDDLIQNIDEWNVASGIGIHHKDHITTIEKLKTYI